MMTLAEKLLLKSEAKAKPGTYVEFVSSTAMTITPKYTNPGVTLQYSLNGTSWTTITSGATTPNANIIYFRGSATGSKSLFNSSIATNAWTFTGATNLECNGKLDRLIQSTLGSNIDILTVSTHCFSHMFYNIISLVKAPVLPATTLATNCYNGMFRGCTSLTTAPVLPATTLATSCYYAMFYGCTSLVTSPELPATTLATSCYGSMFFGCTSLVTAPTLPATTLANYCYHQMFYGCTSLTTAPTLPATTLASYCYSNMFNGCTKIKLSTTMTGIYDTAYRIPTTGTGTTATDALTNMFTGTGGTFISTPEINTTYYTENTPV